MVQSSTVDRFTRTPMTQGRFAPESELTHRIEHQATRIPPVGYLGLAVASMVGSAALAIFADRKEFANFIGLWAPSFLLIGIYNKLVKIEESEITQHDPVRRSA